MGGEPGSAAEAPRLLARSPSALQSRCTSSSARALTCGSATTRSSDRSIDPGRRRLSAVSLSGALEARGVVGGLAGSAFARWTTRCPRAAQSTSSSAAATRRDADCPGRLAEPSPAGPTPARPRPAARVLPGGRRGRAALPSQCSRLSLAPRVACACVSEGARHGREGRSACSAHRAKLLPPATERAPSSSTAASSESRRGPATGCAHLPLERAVKGSIPIFLVARAIGASAHAHL